MFFEKGQFGASLNEAVIESLKKRGLGEEARSGYGGRQQRQTQRNQLDGGRLRHGLILRLNRFGVKGLANGEETG